MEHICGTGALVGVRARVHKNLSEFLGTLRWPLNPYPAYTHEWAALLTVLAAMKLKLACVGVAQFIQCYTPYLSGMQLFGADHAARWVKVTQVIASPSWVQSCCACASMR
jgi:hypothetical protein